MCWLFLSVSFCLQLIDHMAFGQSYSTEHGGFVFRDFLPPERLPHTLESYAASHWAQTLLGFSRMKMKECWRLEWMSQILPLQKSLLNTTPHFRGSLSSPPLPQKRRQKKNPKVWDTISIWLFLQRALEIFLHRVKVRIYTGEVEGRDKLIFQRGSNIVRS